ncbi:MAG: hypothetical protein PHW33_01150 [Candidatus Portnoybacteria bacterium]|nr:hypothetical protein [Candidatus Portnoybacteria bacterium]
MDSVYVEVLRLIQATAPKFRIICKSDSRLHRFIGWALRFPWAFGWAINKRYLEAYWTTIGQTTAYPTSTVDPATEYGIILHEAQHARQAKRWSLLFGPLYLLGTPVYLVAATLLALLALPLWLFVAPWWISLMVVGVGAVLSSPVPFGRFRAAQEYDAYAITIAVEYWRKGRVSDDYLAWIEHEFTSSAYCFMHPSKRAVAARLRTIRDDVVHGTLFQHPRHGKLYNGVYEILCSHGLTTVDYSKPTA